MGAANDEPSASTLPGAEPGIERMATSPAIRTYAVIVRCQGIMRTRERDVLGAIRRRLTYANVTATTLNWSISLSNPRRSETDMESRCGRTPWKPLGHWVTRQC